MEKDALVTESQVSNLQGNTGSPSAEIPGRTESRGAHMAGWEEKGGWQARGGDFRRARCLGGDGEGA